MISINTTSELTIKDQIGRLELNLLAMIFKNFDDGIFWK